MKWAQDDVMLFPEDERELFRFLFRINQEWKFLLDAFALEIPGYYSRDIAAITSARDKAIELFNSHTESLAGKEWFRVTQRCSQEELQEQDRLAITAKEYILLLHRCEHVLVNISKTERTIYDAVGNEISYGELEGLELHCILAPPKNDTLKVLPLEKVTNVYIFNH
jgi:hypothetical protein